MNLENPKNYKFLLHITLSS